MTVQNDETENFEVTSSDSTPTAEPQEAPQTESTDSNEDAIEEKQEGSAEPTTEPEEAETPPEPKPDAPKAEGKGKGVEKRISKLVRQREELKRENEKLKADKAKPESKELNEEDFETYDEYLDAVDEQTSIDTKADEDTQKAEKTGRSEPTDNQKTAVAVLHETLNNSEKPENFDSVALAQDVDITPDMVESLIECENPVDVMMKLGNDKALATEIANKSPVQQGREIAKLDLSINSKPQKVVKTTNAPDPISPVRGSDAQQKSPSEMNFTEYEAYMNKQEGRG